MFKVISWAFIVLNLLCAGRGLYILITLGTLWWLYIILIPANIGVSCLLLRHLLTGPKKPLTGKQISSVVAGLVAKIIMGGPKIVTVQMRGDGKARDYLYADVGNNVVLARPLTCGVAVFVVDSSMFIKYNSPEYNIREHGNITVAMGAPWDFRQRRIVTKKMKELKNEEVRAREQRRRDEINNNLLAVGIDLTPKE